MWIYEKRLQIPVDIKKRDLKMAKDIFDALGGADGELAASMEYFTNVIDANWSIDCHINGYRN